MTDDGQLLQQYARERSESAFGELVTRHIDLVYSTSLRVTSSERASQKRGAGALDKLRGVLSRRGVALPATALTSAMAAEAVTAAPAGFAVSVTAASVAAAAGTGTTLTLLKSMAATKLKTGVISAIVVASVATPLLVQHQAQARLREQDQALRQRTDQLAKFQPENEQLSKLLPAAKSSRPPSNDQLSELMRLRGEVGRLRRDVQEL